MTIRTKLLLFIPLLVLLANLVTFFLFESKNIVQQSYGTMMDRILLYKQSAQAAEQTLKTLYGFLINPAGGSTGLEQRQTELTQLRVQLALERNVSPHASDLASYLHLLDTLKEQEQAALASALAASPGTALDRYEEAEKTFGFIREEGQRLVDLELSSYKPVYGQIQAENERMNRLGLAVFIVNTLTGIVLAVWISRSITIPVGRLVNLAQRISKGDLQAEAEAAPARKDDELGILSAAFRQMLADLLILMQKEKESLEKDRLVKELELQALQSQMNPHFLFNTLNALSKLALLEGAGKTSDLIVSMSNLLRYNLSKLDKPVTLKDELEHVQEYIAIQQARFRDRITFETDIDRSVLHVQLPALTIQPLVENAFVHGIESMEKGALIRISVRSDPEGVRLTVSDNGKGMSEETRQSLLRLDKRALPETADAGKLGKTQSTGLGTSNVFKRLQLFYGRNDLVDIQSAPGQGTAIAILIPQEKESVRTDVSTADRR